MIDLGHGYIGFHEIWEAHPALHDLQDSAGWRRAELVYEEKYWLGHFNASPNLPNVITFCHEGPWNQVDNRIWGLDIDDRQGLEDSAHGPGESVGHEYWIADGEHIGYHGSDAARGPSSARSATTTPTRSKRRSEYKAWHFHSHTLDYVVADGTPRIRTSCSGGSATARSRGRRCWSGIAVRSTPSGVHVHPCVNAPGTQVVYTADPQGYGQVFVVDVPDFDSLPDRSSLPPAKREGP